MDQGLWSVRKNRKAIIADLSRFIAAAVKVAGDSNEPFHHLHFNRVFPDDIYASMLETMPNASDYRPMHGRSKGLDLADGTHTRVKIDLFPEYIRHLAPEKRPIWEIVGRALCSDEVKSALVHRLAGSLQARFGYSYADVGLYPVPVLTRDVAGYSITPHTDTHWKAVTMQLYLPRDESISHVGTIFHKRLNDGTLARSTQMEFSPNTGYAFAVDSDTWHSADVVGPEVTSRDSILHTYFADAGALRYLRNRGKRIGNFLLNEIRARGAFG